MGLLGKWFGGNIGTTVKEIGEGVSTIATSLRSAITGELPPKVRGELEKVATEADALAMKTQGEITKAESQSPSLFIAGWRPTLGWICVTGLGLHFIVSPLIQWIAVIVGKTVSAPVFEVGALISLVLTLLGVGTMRSYEKTKGVHDKH